MAGEQYTCGSCARKFPVGDDDLEFYRKIGVPVPGFCPECRNQRRMAWRNERSLYKRRCDAPGHTEDIVSMYAPDSPCTVYDSKYWWSDEWDPLEYGLEYKEEVPFFVQFSELLKRVPMVAVSNMNSVNSDYTNYVDGNKNCYLIFGTGFSENLRYSNKVLSGTDSQDLMVCTKCELSYECINCVESYHLLWSMNSKNCNDSAFLYSCRNCSNCLGCANLVSKSYCMWNRQFTRDDYLKELENLKLGTREGFENAERKFREEIYREAIHRYANIFNATGCTGDNINSAKDCINCFDIYQNTENSKYLYSALDLKDCYDGNGIYKNELSYELVDCNVGHRNLSSITIYDSDNVAYSINCHGSSNLFGCVGLRSKEYCILNRQYSKEEYKNMRESIVREMNEEPYRDAKGRTHCYGDFFPMELSLWGYNETISQEYYTLSKEAAGREKLNWTEPHARDYAVTLKADELLGDIGGVKDGITQEVIGCLHEGRCNEQCTVAFRIIPEELQFYRRINVAIPQLCPNCRHHARLAKRNPLRLWHRSCMCDYKVFENTREHRQHPEGKCPNEFETPYAPDGHEIIYCEECYQAEVS